MSKKVRFELCPWSRDSKTPDTMIETHLNYFTCTLGEAAKWNAEHPHPFHTVNDLIDEQAKELRQRPALTFSGGCNDEDGREMKSDFTYRELRTYSLAAAVRLRRRLQVASRLGAATVGLLCSSTPEFILAWLGLMRLGMSVLLLAPQLQRPAIKHLCEACGVSTIFADARNYDKVKGLKDGSLAINTSHILFNLKSDRPPTTFTITSKSDDIAYFFHTSGTSSGLPKPTPQSHYAAVGVLPRLPGGESHATFSTTPLYHGGIADCLRAWASGATIHLFPGTRPITADNIQRALNRANSYLQCACPVKYFTCVPYILQLLLGDTASTPGGDDADPPGLHLLQQMDLVGIGGAALPPSVGDHLVANDVKLVSRFGSAESGFLLSSHRDYVVDREWSYLRADPDLLPDYYDFEPQTPADSDSSPSLFEFVVKPKWPHRGKTNRPDGSFATADLFEKHPTIPNAWRYHSRADAQITLVNGKKFDPAPMEGELLAAKEGKRLLADVLIFGTGREAPGVLLFPKWASDYVSDEQVIKHLWPTIERMNSETQNHARLRRNNLAVVRGQDGEACELPKSSKGTILRAQAETMFAAEIETAYDQAPETNGKIEDVPDSEVLDNLTTLFDNVLGRHIDTKGDLFAQGVDSVTCTQLRNTISKTFFAEWNQSLPLNVIYDQGSIEKLSSYIIQCRVSKHVVPEGTIQESSEEQLMLNLVEEYRHTIQSPVGSFDNQKERVVILTGATGALGAHILDLLLRDPTVVKIYCLVRAKDPSDARERTRNSLESRQLMTLGDVDVKNSKLSSLPCSISEPKLGLSDSDWSTLVNEATIIIHPAWTVNFSLKLKSFRDQLAGLANLLALRNATRGSAARFVFISSTASVSSSPAGERGAGIAESFSTDPDDASPLGYSRSKWVAENICAAPRVGGSFSDPQTTPAIHSPPDQEEEEKFPIVIIRVGQLCGNKDGVWNSTEAYPIMLSSAKITGCLPELEDEYLSWLPVDIAAKSILELSFLNGTERLSRSSRLQVTPIYHVMNPHQEPAWSDMLEWIKQENVSRPDGEGKLDMKIVSPGEWIQTLEAALNRQSHPAQALLHLWKGKYSGARRNSLPLLQNPLFETKRTRKVSETMTDVEPLSREHVVKMWWWIQSNV